MRSCGAIASLLAATLVVAGCSSDASKTAEPDPNLYPANYRKQIAMFLTENLRDAADFRGAMISEPKIKPVMHSQRYVVCLRFNGGNVRTEKMIIYLGGALQQYVDAKPEQCGDAVYQPYPELAAVAPS